MMTLKGKLVTLEPLDVQKHAQGYFRMAQDENIHKYVGNSVPLCVDETVELLRKYEVYFDNWVILSNETRAVIGIIRLGKPGMEKGKLVAGESEFLASQYWRKGHMKEVKRLFYGYVFDVLSVEVLYADVWEGNINSMKSLESYGYRLLQTQRELFSKTGEYTQKYIYSLNRDDYYRKTGAVAK